METGINERFGRAVALRRARARLTQEQLASSIGLSRTSIANIEQGRQQVLLHHAVAIAQVLGASLEELVVARESQSELRKVQSLEAEDATLGSWARSVLTAAPR